MVKEPEILDQKMGGEKEEAAVIISYVAVGDLLTAFNLSFHIGKTEITFEVSTLCGCFED